jgi:hypothetical protein
MKYSPIKIPFMHTMWFLINMTEYILCWKTVFKIEFHAYGDKEFLVLAHTPPPFIDMFVPSQES